MLKKLKEAFLGDERTKTALREFQELYSRADDPEAFQRALEEGDIDTAAEEANLSVEEMHDRLSHIRELGVGAANDYRELEEYDKEEFLEA